MEKRKHGEIRVISEITGFRPNTVHRVLVAGDRKNKVIEEADKAYRESLTKLKEQFGR